MTANGEKAQAAIELAIFGAILIFVLGTIVRTAVNNGYTQNVNFKATRMALLASWQGSERARGMGAPADMSRNYASILFVEDRLSPDFGKYGTLDRNPFIAQGSGTMSYELFYPWQPGVDSPSQMIPVMDVYINGQHFPLTTAAYVQDNTILRPLSCSYASACLQEQCQRNQREWVGGIVTASQFENIIPVSALTKSEGAYLVAYGQGILNSLITAGVVGTTVPLGWTGPPAPPGAGFVAPGFTSLPYIFAGFTYTDPVTGTPATLALSAAQLNNIQNILLGDMTQYKLFYQLVANGIPQFSTTPPQTCTGVNNALCSTLTVLDDTGTPFTNTYGDMQYDLRRLGDYGAPGTADTNAVEYTDNFPYSGPMRGLIAWQWAATAATTPSSIGLDASSNQFPQYDVDGRLKPVTIYGITQNPDGTPSLTYEDFQGGDIDTTWDTNSCGPKPGLLNSSQLYTFTKQGTYLQIKEGSLFDPETDQFVRSANKRDTIDLIQRTIQLSNNSGRFCDASGDRVTVVQPCMDGSTCTPSGPFNDGVCSDGSACVLNPVEVCIPAGAGDNCFSTETNIKSTCYDETDNRLFVRSRIEDLRGRSWFTDTSGVLQVH